MGQNSIYLSACHIAYSQYLLDETLHLESEFQAAGFTNVIGYMLPAGDDVYSGLQRFSMLSLEDCVALRELKGTMS